MGKKKWLSIIILSGSILLAACNTDTNNHDEHDDGEMNEQTEEIEEGGDMSEEHGNHEEMEHDEYGGIPEGLEEASTPTYPVDTEVTVNANHMSGMDGAEGRVVGAFDTIVYAVSYTPVDGGERVEDHEWVIHEELEESNEALFSPGDEVTLTARHMQGMEGATATIDRVEETTVYMVDFTPTDQEEIIRNHQWLTENELSPAE